MLCVSSSVTPRGDAAGLRPDMVPVAGAVAGTKQVAPVSGPSRKALRTKEGAGRAPHRPRQPDRCPAGRGPPPEPATARPEPREVRGGAEEERNLGTL